MKNDLSRLLDLRRCGTWRWDGDKSIWTFSASPYLNKALAHGTTLEGMELLYLGEVGRDTVFEGDPVDGKRLATSTLQGLDRKSLFYIDVYGDDGRAYLFKKIENIHRKIHHLSQLPSRKIEEFDNIPFESSGRLPKGIDKNSSMIVNTRDEVGIERPVLQKNDDLVLFLASISTDFLNLSYSDLCDWLFTFSIKQHAWDTQSGMESMHTKCFSELERRCRTGLISDAELNSIKERYKDEAK